MNAISANDTGLSGDALDRLALFAEWTGTMPPERILVGAGEDATFSDEMLTYAKAHGLNLDWFVLGDERGLVMAYHREAKKDRAQ